MSKECGNFGLGISCDCETCSQSQAELESWFYGDDYGDNNEQKTKKETDSSSSEENGGAIKNQN